VSCNEGFMDPLVSRDEGVMDPLVSRQVVTWTPKHRWHYTVDYIGW